MDAHAVVLAVLAAVVGMPHGGLDHRVGRVMLRPALGRSWPIAFATAYLAAMALVLTGWLAAPLATLAGFVLLSAVHFGAADDDPGSPGGLALASLQGSAVVWAPALFQPAEFTRLLSWVVPWDQWPEHILFAPSVRVCLAVALAVVLARLIVLPWRSGVRVACFVALFALAPPLVSFVVYFCGWHSPVELVRLARRANPADTWSGFARVVAAAAPLSALAVLFGAVGWYVVASDGPLTPGLVQVVFVGLSVVAVPHVLLNLAAARAGVNPFAIESHP